MNLLKKNIFANFIGKGWSLLMGLVFVPFYIKFLGIEAYGLVGFFIALNTTIHLLEFGLSSTMNREMARYSVWPDRIDEARDLARTLEMIYWIVGLLIALFVYWSAPWIALNWVKSETLPLEAVSRAVAMMGMSIALQWPVSLYSGGIMGFERQVLLNGLTAILGTIRGLGAVLVIWLIAPTITIFFSWQIFASFLQVGLTAFFFWKIIPAGARTARINIKSLQSIWRFTAGMGATGLVTFCLSQLDKVVLSKLLSLSMFGYYNVSNQVNTAIRMSSNSIFAAFLPRMSSLFASEDEKALRIIYHKGCQFVSFIVLPASAVIAFFSYDLIYLWTQNKEVAYMAAPIASVLVVGSAFNSLMGIPYHMTVARGWAMFGFYQNLIAAIIMVPIMILLSKHFGGIGAASAWLILNIGYLIVSMPIIIRRVIPGELRSWYMVDVGRPFLLSFGLIGLGWYFVPGDGALWLKLLMIIMLWIFAQLFCVFALPYIRQQATQILRYRKGSGYGFGIEKKQ